MIKQIGILLLILLSGNTFAQIKTAPEKYWIEFTDKFNNDYQLIHPEEFLSERALQRRNNQNIPIKPEDLPVSKYYIDSLKSLGIKVLNISKWFNAASIFSADTQLIDTLSELSFIKKNIPLKSSATKAFVDSVFLPGKFPEITAEMPLIDYNLATKQLEMVNGQVLHQYGFKGSEKQIAVIDAGFSFADIYPAFDSLWANNRILGTCDFVKDTNHIFSSHSHGMSVLSIIGGNIPGQLTGSAPYADFWLLRSEDGNSEYLVEEDNWIAAAEFADSAGVDIINSSLGYSVFDDSTQNHSYAEMNGKSTRISQAASIAASKGMVVVVSAGNEGNTPWHYISAPADADSILTVGSVNLMDNISTFSSRGPSFDKRIKPDVVAMGQGTFHQSRYGDVRQGNGTSYSAPIISGLAACLWQAFPRSTSIEILSAIRKSASKYYTPDSTYGYGIPDFNIAYRLLQVETSENPEKFFEMEIYPNPFSDIFYIEWLPDSIHKVEIGLFSMSGKNVFKQDYPVLEQTNILTISNLPILPAGIYLLQFNTGDKVFHKKIIKK
ncbi:MAG: S8 family serine peptidase [Bacteroidales bacterium]|nr:S8 family serine peptidase [Bacteroidales bacterium]